MRPIDLSKLKLFYEIAKEGNMNRTAEKLNMPQPSLSRSLNAFEERLKTKLFDRIPSGLRLTPQGERLYALAEKNVNQVNSFERAFYEKEDELEGELKIITTPFVGCEWLVPNLEDFLKKYPKIRIRIILTSDNINFSEADVAICTQFPQYPHLIQKPLFSARVRLFASPSYLKKYGTPKTPEDLDHHRLITYRGNYYTPYGSADWVINLGSKKADSPRESYFEINSLHGMLQSALKGYGIVELPNYSVIQQSGLKEVLIDIQGEEIPLYYIFPNTRSASKKINLLYEYLPKGKP